MANTVDIRGFDISTLSKDEVFAVDTNALIWTHYSKASNPKLKNHSYQVIDYPNFIAQLLGNGNKILTTTLNITELCGVVERNEWNIYKAVNGKIGLKDYRKLHAERIAYQREIDTMLKQIKLSYNNQLEVVRVDEAIIEKFKNNICANSCDIFDFAIIEHLKAIGVKNYISDDKDYSTIDNIILYTTSAPTTVGLMTPTTS